MAKRFIRLPKPLSPFRLTGPDNAAWLLNRCGIRKYPMSRSVVTAEKITPPKELEFFFDDPPLVGNELREDQERSSRAPWKFISAPGPTMRRSSSAANSILFDHVVGAGE